MTSLNRSNATEAVELALDREWKRRALDARCQRLETRSSKMAERIDQLETLVAALTVEVRTHTDNLTVHV